MAAMRRKVSCFKSSVRQCNVLRSAKSKLGTVCKKRRLGQGNTSASDEKSLSLEQAEVGDFIEIYEQRPDNLILRQMSDDPDLVIVEKAETCVYKSTRSDLIVSGSSTDDGLALSLSFEMVTESGQLSPPTPPTPPPAIDTVTISNVCLLGSKEQVSITCNTLFGLELKNGLYLLDSEGQLRPILTETLMSSFGTRNSEAPPSFTHSYKSFNELLCKQFASSSGSSSPPLVLHVHQFVDGSLFPFCSVLEPQFYSLWKPLLFLSSSLKILHNTHVTSPVHFLLSGKTQSKIDLLLQQANVVSSAQSISPSQLLFHLTDADHFLKVTCFGDQSLACDALDYVRLCLTNKLGALFAENTRTNSPDVLILDDSDDLHRPDIPDIINHRESLSWEWFVFLVYIKAYSVWYNQPVMSLVQLQEVASVFFISPDNLHILLSTLQSLQLILCVSEHVIVDPEWLFSSLGELKSLSQVSRSDAPYLFHIEKGDCSPLDLLVHFLGTHRLLVNRGEHAEYFSTIFLPFHHNIEFPDNPRISPIYLLTPLGSMPPGFFERLIATLWMKSSTVLRLKECQSRSSAVFEMKLDKLDDYTVHLTNASGYIKVSLATLYNVDVSYSSLCAVASKVIGELKERIKEILPTEVKGQQVLSAFFECQDSRCSQVKGHLHLTRVLTSYLECMRKSYRTKLCDVEESQSFWIASRQKQCFNVESTYLFPKATEPASFKADDLVLDTITSNHIKITKQDSLASDTNGTDSMVSEYIDSHYTDIVDKLDLRIRNQLYQSKILVNPDQLDAIAMAENAFQRSQGIKMILDAVKANGFGGVMALVAAIKADSGSDESDDHYALLQSLTNDSVYATLKTCWIRTVTDQFCAS